MIIDQRTYSSNKKKFLQKININCFACIAELVISNLMQATIIAYNTKQSNSNEFFTFQYKNDLDQKLHFWALFRHRYQTLLLVV